MSYPYIGCANLGVSKAAATIAASVVDLTGAALGTQPTRNVVNLGGGAFGISIPAMPDGQTGWVLVQEAGTTLTALTINPREVENADMKVSTRSGHSAADVWAVGTRTLSAFAFSVDVSSVAGEPADPVTPDWLTVTDEPLNVNVVTILGAVPTVETGTQLVALTANGLDLVMVEADVNMRQAGSVLLAHILGVRSLVTTNNPVIMNPAGTAVRVAPTNDPVGNRSAVTLTPYNP